MKYWVERNVEQEVYLEATYLPVNLSNQLMEELDMIKR
jgi:hypothetical protein